MAMRLLCRNIRKAQKASMNDPFNIYEFSEISIDGHQNPAFSCCVFEQCLIARVWAHFTGICNIMALTAAASSLNDDPRIGQS